MASVTTITLAKALEIENASVVSGSVNSETGHLILETQGGAEIDAGDVVPPFPTVKTIAYTKTASEGGGTFKKANFPGLTRLVVDM